MKKISKLGIIALVLFLQACNLSKDYEMPSYEELAVVRDNESKDSSSFADLQWQEVYQDEQLKG